MRHNNYGGILQHPIGSGFNGKTTAAEVIKGIDLTGKIAIVTGGHTGIGLENVKQRLQLLYPDRNELMIRETTKEFFVHLTVQL